MKIIYQQNHILLLYKKILKESSQFFDEQAKLFLKERTRKRFRECKDETDEKRISMHITNARKCLYQLQRANVFDLKSVVRILEFTYGLKGPKRHELLKPIINVPSPEPKPFISSAPRTAPPRISPPLEALLNSQVKSLYPPLPQPKHKPLHPRRKANILWWHYSKIMKNVTPPVSQDILNELELKAGKSKLTQCGLSKVNKDAILKSIEKDDRLKLPPSFEFIREKSPSKRFKDPPYHTAKPHRPKPRYIRRIYQRLLSNIPILTLKESIESNSDDGQKENYGSSLKAKDFIVTKSVWANGRPKPLINDKDWQGLDPEEVIKNLKGKKKN